VFASVVMVYRRVGVLASSGTAAVLFLFKQVAFAALGCWVVRLPDARRLPRTTASRSSSGGCSASCRRRSSSSCFGPTINGTGGGFGVAGIGVQPSELAEDRGHRLHGRAILERRMERTQRLKYALAPIGLVRRAGPG